MKLQVVSSVEGPDLDGVRELLDAVRVHDDHSALGEHKWLDLVHGGRRGMIGVIARLPDDDRVAGYAHLSCSPDAIPKQWALEAVVHPEHRNGSVELELVRRGLDEARAAGGGHLHLWVFRPTPTHDEIARALGLTRGRHLYQMRCPLPHPEAPRWPDDMEVRSFEPGRDEGAWLDVNNRAFRRHPEQGAWDMETLKRRMSESWFDPRGFLLAFQSGKLAGFCWTKVHADEHMGEIYVIGVDPEWEGRGLGRALVLAGMDWLAEAGLPTVMLYVDAANEPAVKLYEKLGYTVHHVDRAYVTDL